MLTKCTPGSWVATHINPTLDSPASWEKSPPIVTSASGDIAEISLEGRTEDEVRANARAIAAIPHLLAAAALPVLDPRIRAFLEANDPKALEQLRGALAAAGVEL